MLKVYQLFLGDLSFKHSQLLKSSAFPVKLTSIARLLLAILSPCWRLQTNSWWKLTPVRITEFITDDELHKFFANSRPKQLTQMCLRLHINVTCQTFTSYLSQFYMEDWNLYNSGWKTDSGVGIADLKTDDELLNYFANSRRLKANHPDISWFAHRIRSFSCCSNFSNSPGEWPSTARDLEGSV